MRCELHRRWLFVDEDAELAPVTARHVASCLACQAEHARYRRVLRLLAQLRSEQAALAPGVLAQLVDAIGAAAEQRTSGAAVTRRRLVPTVRGAPPVVLALAATVLVLTVLARLDAPALGARSRRSAPSGQCYR